MLMTPVLYVQDVEWCIKKNKVFLSELHSHTVYVINTDAGCSYCSEHRPQRLIITVMIIDKPLNFVTCSQTYRSRQQYNTNPPPAKNMREESNKVPTHSHTHTDRHWT